MRLVLAEPGGVAELSPSAARRAWVAAAEVKDSGAVTAEVEAAVRALGGEIDLDASGAVVYRFATEARERRALQALRAAAPSAEALPGAVVFSSGEQESDEADEIDGEKARALIEAARGRREG
jgi:hypothetical protein